MTIDARAGGVLTLGALRLQLPAGALSSNSTVSAKLVTKAPPTPGATVVSDAFEVNLGVATLQASANVTVSFDESKLASSSSGRDVFLARYNNGSREWEPLASTVDTNAKTIAASFDHFSIFEALSTQVDTFVAPVLDFYTKALRVAGIRSNPPNCPTPSKDASYKLIPKIQQTTGPTIPASVGDFVNLVLVCINGANGQQVHLKVVNNRSYSQLLVPQVGLSVGADQIAPGSANQAIDKVVEGLFNAGNIYLPAGSEDDITATVPSGSIASIDVETSQVTLILDGAEQIFELLFPQKTTLIGLMKCAYAAAAAGGSGAASIADLGKIVQDCAAPVASGLVGVELGPIVTLLNLQLAQFANQIDTTANTVLGGSEGIQVQLYSVSGVHQLKVGIV